MKILHQLGHNKNWNVDSYFDQGVGDGFIFHAYSFEQDDIGRPICKHDADEFMDKSLLDLQFYGSKESIGGKLDTYSFHPINDSATSSTEVSTIDAIKAGIKFQEEKGFKKVIIPHILRKTEKSDYTTHIIEKVSSYIAQNRKKDTEYFMTLPFSGEEIKDESRIERILQSATDMKIEFDGYYVVCEPNLTTKKKVSEDPDYYDNLSRVLSTLKLQGFKTILGFANVDALVFLSITDIDYVSIGTFEVLRNFNIKRFTEEVTGGASKGWYFSEKLLSFVRSQELELIRKHDGITLIKNEDNVFSDEILKDGYDWNTLKPDVHKNYLLSVSKLLNELAAIEDVDERLSFMLEKALGARKLYRELETKSIFLSDESSGHHLPSWQSTLSQNLSH